MKLKAIKSENTRTGEPKVSIGKSGSFQFNLHFLEFLKKELSTSAYTVDQLYLEFYQDEEDPQNWYIWPNLESKGLKLRVYGDAKGPMVSSSSIAARIKESTGNETDKTLSAMVGKKYTEYAMDIYPLLIKKGNLPLINHFKKC